MRDCSVKCKSIILFFVLEYFSIFSYLVRWCLWSGYLDYVFVPQPSRGCGDIPICYYIQWRNIGRFVLLFTHSSLRLLGFYFITVIRYHSLLTLSRLPKVTRSLPLRSNVIATSIHSSMSMKFPFHTFYHSIRKLVEPKLANYSG